MNASKKELPPPDAPFTAMRRRYARAEEEAAPSVEGPADAPADALTGPPMGTPADASTTGPTGTPTDAPADVSTVEPTDAPADSPTSEPTDAPADAPADGRARPRAHARMPESAPHGPELPAHGRTTAPTTRRPTKPAPKSPAVPQPPRRELDVAGRSYRAGLDRLQPRTDRLTTAVRAMLKAGAGRSEVLGLLAETGLTERDLPGVVLDQLDP